MNLRTLLPTSALLVLTSVSLGQVSESTISRGIDGLRNVPDPQRPAATKQLAEEIRTLPAGPGKLKLADQLTHLSTEGDAGIDVLQAVADTLAQAIQQAPPLPGKKGGPMMPYMDLARLVRYEGVKTTLTDPMLNAANEILVKNDEDVEKADFTLKNLNGKKVTLSALRGKIVLVNFWATGCLPCRKEVSDLDLIYTHYANQGLVVLSISSENAFLVNSFIRSRGGYHPEVLIDDGSKVSQQFHVDGLPRTFVFNRDGKLVAEAIDMRTQRQFFAMLAAAGLQPQ